MSFESVSYFIGQNLRYQFQTNQGHVLPGLDLQQGTVLEICELEIRESLVTCSIDDWRLVL